MGKRSPDLEGMASGSETSGTFVLILEDREDFVWTLGTGSERAI